jgi:hypothetical protein
MPNFSAIHYFLPIISLRFIFRKVTNRMPKRYLTVAETVRRHLQMGDKVRLKGFGLLKLEIESEKVDNLKDFRAKKHIRGVRLHFIPESEKGSPELYQGITFEKDKPIKDN